MARNFIIQNPKPHINHFHILITDHLSRKEEKRTFIKLYRDRLVKK